MSLPPMSKKRAAAIKDGTFKPKPRKPMKRTCITAKEFQKIKLPSTGKNARAKAKKRAWDIFSKWIRLRDSDENGMVKCITCPSKKHWKDMDAGHYITRAKESTLFMEENVSGQCGGCNRFQGGKFLEHAQAVDRKFGPGTRDRIEQKAFQMCKRTLNDYLFIEAVYKERVELMRKNDPQKFDRCAA